MNDASPQEFRSDLAEILSVCTSTRQNLLRDLGELEGFDEAQGLAHLQSATQTLSGLIEIELGLKKLTTT